MPRIFADDFVDMMTQQIIVQTFISRSDEGVASYASPQTYQCRINFKTKNIFTGPGQMVTARGTAWLDTVDPISTNDRIIFPDGTEPKILEVNQESDEVGPAFTSLLFQ
jgi:hypothetical protein